MADLVYKKSNKNIRTSYVLGIFIFLFFLAVGIFFDFSSPKISIGINVAKAACPPDTADCNYDGIDGCEVNLLSDNNNNCGACGKVCGIQDGFQSTCENGSCYFPAPPYGGIVPCGRLRDNPTTSEIDESAPCTLCALFYMLKNIINFVMTLAIGIGVFILVIAGLLYALSAGNSRNIELAKSAVTSAIIGIAIIFIAWLAIAVILQGMGYANMATWNQVACTVKPGGTSFDNSFCGDDLVQAPNGKGFNEQCETGESLANFTARGAGTPEQWVRTIYRCQANCTLGCSSLAAAEIDKIGTGCYLDLNNNGVIDVGECQKGKFVCDFANNKVVCDDVFGSAKYIGRQQYTGGPYFDYCCNGVAASGELADGKIMGAPFDIVKATVSDIKTGATGTKAWVGLGCPVGCADFDTGLWGGSNPNANRGGWGAGKGFRCDDVCKNMGKICVGVGLTDPSLNRCIYIQHDEGSTPGGCNNDRKAAISMSLPANQAATNCDAWFGMFYYSNYRAASGAPVTGDSTHWSTGYDKYVYNCAKYDPLSYWTKDTTWINVTAYADVPAGSEGVCKPLSPDTCGFHGFDLVETACYCL